MPKRFFVALFAVLLTLVLTLIPTDAKATVSRHEVQTDKGPVVGTFRNGSEAFLGVPYAAPPVGSLRWKAPQPPAAWTKALRADLLSSICPQSGTPFGGSGTTVIGNEDCLYLNVFRPTKIRQGEKLPVMVWIHGGAFVSGSANEYDGSDIAEHQRVIVIAMNYRLGALGFLAHPALSQETSERSGNYGLLDQQLALKWTQTNAAAFGGDPDRVTIFGESAGGASVCSQLVSPLAKGLFHRAIIESGLCTYQTKDVSIDSAEQSGIALANQFHCTEQPDPLACLRQVSPKDLVNAPAPGVGISGQGSWGTVYGTSALPVKELEAFTTGQFNKVPVMNGSNRDEGRLFALFMSLNGAPVTPALYELMTRQMFAARADEVLKLYPVSEYEKASYAFSTWLTDSTFSCPALRTNEALSAHVPTFSYEFSDRQAPISIPVRSDLPETGAYHASEIAYVFQRQWPLADPAKFSVDQKQLAKQMQSYWANFARSGDPNGSGTEAWSEFKSGAYIQDLAPGRVKKVSDFANAHHCDFWNR